ncbi:glycoside hydrolase [Gymnopus androsaceus JB14]|uniref:Trehalase n=1 Tax=Gymnopus androsaceus JB14 TaxID=1447944 RepID=A0A6A4HEA0_9AGAR|nr:glycoside hydrolase [Gymnopus androsaceus JB14]
MGNQTICYGSARIDPANNVGTKDPKTFVDKPTSKSSANVEADFQNINTSNTTEGDIVQTSLVLPDFPSDSDPNFLQNVTDPLLKAWSQTVNGFWSQLIRKFNSSALCPIGSSGTCTLIPLNHTFVFQVRVSNANRFFWDSFWIIEGLIQSELCDNINSTLPNFMDELETLGFIPNGGRIHYLNRSQPPLFIQMLSRYINATNDLSILERALPLAEKELAWWQNNRTLSVVSPFTNRTYSIAHYAANNTAPRPESYLTCYQMAHAPRLNLSTSQLTDLYAELASGAETGTFLASPAPGNDDLTTLVNHIILADLYGSSNTTAANAHPTQAASIREGILDLFGMRPSLRTNSRNGVFSSATFYPIWSGIIPDEILCNGTNAFKAFSAGNMVMKRYNGSWPITFFETTLQWYGSNAWPPHQYIIIEALRALPLNESQLSGQPVRPGVNASASGVSADFNELNGTVVNGGNATDGEGWGSALQRMMANRHVTSVLCSWKAIGGSIPGVSPRLSDEDLNVTQSINNTGNMFEKLNTMDVDSSGSGVYDFLPQAGFGWTASNYGNVLVAPDCSNVIKHH